MSPEMSKTYVMVAGALTASSHLPFMNIAVPVRKHVNSRTVARLQKKRFLDTTTDPMTAVKSEADMMDVTEAAELSYPSAEAVAAQEAFLQAMPTVCRVYTAEFCNLHNTQELQGGKSLEGIVKFLFCNFSYDIHRQHVLQNSNYDVFNTKFINAFCNLPEYVLKRGGQRHIVCFIV